MGGGKYRKSIVRKWEIKAGHKVDARLGSRHAGPSPTAASAALTPTRISWRGSSSPASTRRSPTYRPGTSLRRRHVPDS
jgi:hypothetical protein